MSPSVSLSVTPSPTPSTSTAASQSDFTETFTWAIPAGGSNFGTSIIYSGVTLNGASFSGIGGWTRQGTQATGFEIVEASNMGGVDGAEDFCESSLNFPGNSSDNLIPDTFTEDTLDNGLSTFHAVDSSDAACAKCAYDSSNPPKIKVQVAQDGCFSYSELNLTKGSTLEFTVRWLF